MKTLDKVLIIIGAYIGAFVVATVIIYTVNGWQYDALIPCVVGGGVLEAINTMIITVNKIKRGSDAVSNTGNCCDGGDIHDAGDCIQFDANEKME